MPHKFDPARRARLEDPARAELLPPESLLSGAGLRLGMWMADIGCGPGFFTLPASALVGPSGQVFAIDISEEMLEAVREKTGRSGVSNVVTLRATEDRLPLADRSADFVLLAFVLHEAVNPQRFVREVVRILKTSGRVLLLEWEKREMEMGPPVMDRLSSQETRTLFEGAGISVLQQFAPNAYHYGLVGVENDRDVTTDGGSSGSGSRK